MTTPNLGLVEITDGQSGAFATHNEALRWLDALRVGAISRSTTAEPGSPVDGDLYILASTHTGTNWAAQAENDLALYKGTAWAFLTPAQEGFRIYVDDENDVVTFDGTSFVGENEVSILGDTTGGTDDIDLDAGRTVTATVSTAAQTFTFSNPRPTGTKDSFTLILTNGQSQGAITWPASVDWAGGTAPTLTAAGVDILEFITVDGGTIWHGRVLSTDSK